jgi:hypothetical protein
VIIKKKPKVEKNPKKKIGITVKQHGIITLGFFVVKEHAAYDLMNVMPRSGISYVVCHFIVFAKTVHDSR